MNTLAALRYKFHTKWLANSFQKSYCVSPAHMIQAINTGENCLRQILDTIPPESEALSPSDTLNIFRLLTKTFENLPKSSTPFNILDHKNFQILRQAMKASVPYFKSNEKFDILKSIRALSVPMNDSIFSELVSSLQENVHSMSLNDIMIFDNITRASEMDQLTKEAAYFNRTLIERFNIKASQLTVQFSYFIKIRRLLHFIARNQNRIKEEVFVNIENCLSTECIDICTADEAMEIIILLSRLNNRCDYFKSMLYKAFDVWSARDVTMQMIEITLTLLAKYHSCSLYNDPRFIEKCVQVAINGGDLQKCFDIQRLFNRLDFTSNRLIDFILENLNNEKIKDNLVYNCITICIACDLANYRPPLFHSVLLPTLATVNFHQQFDIRMNWPKFALWLHLYGVHHQPLIDEILEYKTDFDVEYINQIECIQLEKLINASIKNLLPNFRSIVGDNVRFLVRTRYDAIIPMLLKIDNHSKKFVPIEDTESNSIHTIQFDDNQSLVAIVTPSLTNLNYLPNITTLVLSSSDWISLLNHSSTDEIFSDIQNRIEKSKNQPN